MSAYAESPSEPQKRKCGLFGARRRAEEAVRMAEDARKVAEDASADVERLSGDIGERLDGARAAIEQRLDRLSEDIGQLNRAVSKPEPTLEEELGHLLMTIIKAGHIHFHLHKKLAQFVSEKTARGVSRAAAEALEANQHKLLKPGVREALTRLAADPLNERDRNAKSGRLKRTRAERSRGSDAGSASAPTA